MTLEFEVQWSTSDTNISLYNRSVYCIHTGSKFDVTIWNKKWLLLGIKKAVILAYIRVPEWGFETGFDCYGKVDALPNWSPMENLNYVYFKYSCKDIRHDHYTSMRSMPTTYLTNCNFQNKAIVSSVNRYFLPIEIFKKLGNPVQQQFEQQPQLNCFRYVKRTNFKYSLQTRNRLVTLILDVDHVHQLHLVPGIVISGFRYYNN